MEKSTVNANPERVHVDMEQQVNFEPNDSLVLCERLQCPALREQLVLLLCTAYEERAADSRPEYKLAVDKETNVPLRDLQGRLVFEPAPYVPPTRAEVEQEIARRLAEVESVTWVSSDGREPSPNHIDINWRMPSGEKPTTKQYAIIEAHEKGHAVRYYPSFGSLDPIRRHFMQGFDVHAVTYTQEDFENEQTMLEGMSYEDAKEELFSYLFKPTELAERMSQLKNYFGMRGTEQFTKEHLHYARGHYVADTGMDNRMTHFFQAITPVKEDRFIELINTVGI